MVHQAPKTIWEVASELKFEEPLEFDDPRLVDTDQARGSFKPDRVLRHFGVNPRTDKLEAGPDRAYALFCGHRGCGKSTELRRLFHRLDDPERFYCVFLDVLSEVDVNNLQYSDILMALAKNLFEFLERDAIAVPSIHLAKLERWFMERVEKHEQTKTYAAEITTGLDAEGGIPFLARLYARITSSFKVNSSHKEELRQTIKNSFTEFADAFNQLLRVVEDEVQSHAKGKKLLFIVDGTDRLAGEDSKRFFIDDVHQLQLIESNFLYCAPISLLYEGNQVQQLFDPFVLPMIKLREKDDSGRLETGFVCLREMVYRRADRALFDSEETVDFLIENTGGNPRHVIRLLQYAHVFAEDERFDRAAVEKAVAQLATEMRRFLEAEDYELLHRIDHDHVDRNSERVRFLLYNLALLEYNGFWRMSHPVIRTLPAYRTLEKAGGAGAGSGDAR